MLLANMSAISIEILPTLFYFDDRSN